ncbi:MAG: hypothetical protein IPP51_17605 [Bacteroidetes bacterium]|nr:hypothetical protein [Bacteroidota bacterium]
MQQTNDGGYVLIGFTVGVTEMYVVKTDSLGNVEWANSYGATLGNEGESIVQTADNGFLFSGDGNANINLIKTDALGTIEWAHAYGSTSVSRAYSVNNTNDNGCIVCGYVESAATLSKDFYLMKLNSFGDTVWTKTYGETGSEEARAVQQTSDGGYIVVGQVIF